MLHCHNLLPYALLYYETKLPFLGWENGDCDAAALGFVRGVLEGGGDHLLQQRHRGVKTPPFPPRLRVAVPGEQCGAVGQRAGEGWGNRCERAEQQLMQKSPWAAVQRQPHSHRRKQTGLFSSRDSTRKLPPRWALQGTRSQAWIQKALPFCSDSHAFINSGRMFTHKSPFFSHVSLQTETQNN